MRETDRGNNPIRQDEEARERGADPAYTRECAGECQTASHEQENHCFLFLRQPSTGHVQPALFSTASLCSRPNCCATKGTESDTRCSLSILSTRAHACWRERRVRNRATSAHIPHATTNQSP